MSTRRASIAQVMFVIVLVAANLALVRAAPAEISIYPTMWVLLGLIDFVVFWKLIAKRPLRAFHYTFLAVLIPGYLVMATLADTGRIQPLFDAVRWYQWLSGGKRIGISLGFLRTGEIWMAFFVSLVLACALALIAARLEIHRHWDIAAFWRGAIVGVGISVPLGMIHDTIWGPGPPSPGQWIGHLILVAACVIGGGAMGPSRFKSEGTDHTARILN